MFPVVGLDGLFQVGQFLTGDVDLLVQFLEERLGVLRLGEEAHVVLPRGDFLLFLHELLDKPVAFAADGALRLAGETAGAFAEFTEYLADGLAVGILDAGLLLEGYEADGVPALLEGAQGFPGVFLAFGGESADLVDQLALLLQVLGLLGVLAAGMFVAAVEEGVAGGAVSLRASAFSQSSILRARLSCIWLLKPA